MPMNKKTPFLYQRVILSPQKKKKKNYVPETFKPIKNNAKKCERQLSYGSCGI